MKHEWKKHEKNLYSAKKLPSLIEIPPQNFIMIKGSGNPNDTDFSNRVSALYSLSYAIKMEYKSAAAKDCILNDIHDFTVYPLEGIWEQKEGQNLFVDDTLIKENLKYTIMIRQPDFITKEIFFSSLEQVRIKKPNLLYEEIFFDAVPGGKYVEILHVGPYDSEPDSFAKMDDFLKENGLQRLGDSHREIYLSNANRTAVEKLKTILRYWVS